MEFWPLKTLSEVSGVLLGLQLSPTPNMGVHLGVWGFTPSHSLHSLHSREHVMWLLGLLLGPQPLNFLALAASQMLGLRQGCCVGQQMFGRWKKRWRRSPPMLTLVVYFLEYKWCPHTEWNWDWDQQRNMSLCKGGVGWDPVARLLLWLVVLVFQLLGSFHSLYLKFDKLLRALASYVPWVTTVKTQVVCPSAKFLGFCQRFKLSCVDLHRGRSKRGRSKRGRSGN
jgi:hypothetical protein